MKYPTVGSVMTRPVITVSPDMPFKQIARTLAEHRISAVPVVDEAGRVTGVVSEADLMARETTRGGLDQVLTMIHRVRGRKAHAGTARGLMTAPVVTIGPDASVADAASKLSRANIRRLFVVVGDGRLAGVLSRADVLRLFLVADDEIFDQVLKAVPDGVGAAVADGVVTLCGRVERRSQALAAIRDVWALPGVVAVAGSVEHQVDDVDPGVA